MAVTDLDCRLCRWLGGMKVDDRLDEVVGGEGSRTAKFAGYYHDAGYLPTLHN